MDEGQAQGILQSAFDRHVTPLLDRDQGAVSIVSIKKQIVTLRLEGACRGCPGKKYTLQSILEPTCKAALGDDVRVALV